MDSRAPNSRLEVLLKGIDLPAHAYEQAESRYKDLGQWIARPESTLARHDAHVFVQGSFALGTAIRPINDDDEYDLDFTCKLREGVSRDTHSQQELKALVGGELAAYRHARQIDRPLQPKNRCWRLRYKDKELPFHMDVVPGIRADDDRRRYLREQMELHGVPTALAQDIARKALWITDQQHRAYRTRSLDWPSSNPGGYQQWFLSRMRAPEQRGVLAEAQIDPVPVYRSKTALQQVVQLLKRHRDIRFASDSDVKPASVLITTIAGQVYVHGESLTQTLRRALLALDQVRRSDTDKIPNPINPQENFADRWRRDDCLELELKRHFHEWVEAANRDFDAFLDSPHAGRLVEMAEDHFGLKLSQDAFRGLNSVVAAPAMVRQVHVDSTPARPWRE